jgi:DNA repair exonuclease SbcCD ATPase subunit
MAIYKNTKKKYSVIRGGGKTFGGIDEPKKFTKKKFAGKVLKVIASSPLTLSVAAAKTAADLGKATVTGVTKIPQFIQLAYQKIKKNSAGKLVSEELGFKTNSFDRKIDYHTKTVDDLQKKVDETQDINTAAILSKKLKTAKEKKQAYEKKILERLQSAITKGELTTKTEDGTLVPINKPETFSINNVKNTAKAIRTAYNEKKQQAKTDATAPIKQNIDTLETKKLAKISEFEEQKKQYEEDLQNFKKIYATLKNNAKKTAKETIKGKKTALENLSGEVKNIEKNIATKQQEIMKKEKEKQFRTSEYYTNKLNRKRERYNKTKKNIVKIGETLMTNLKSTKEIFTKDAQSGFKNAIVKPLRKLGKSTYDLGKAATYDLGKAATYDLAKAAKNSPRLRKYGLPVAGVVGALATAPVSVPAIAAVGIKKLFDKKYYSKSKIYNKIEEYGTNISSINDQLRKNTTDKYKKKELEDKKAEIENKLNEYKKFIMKKQKTQYEIDNIATDLKKFYPDTTNESGTKTENQLITTILGTETTHNKLKAINAEIGKIKPTDPDAKTKYDSLKQLRKEMKLKILEEKITLIIPPYKPKSTTVNESAPVTRVN